MQWVAPSEKDTATDLLEKRLWDAADQLRVNAAQYSTSVLGLIFLRFADIRFAKIRAGLAISPSRSRSSRRSRFFYLCTASLQHRTFRRE